MIIVSACLCGINTRYDGKNSLDNRVLELLRCGKVIPVCPEQLGGLTTPRNPCEICSGRGKEVIDGKAKIVDAYGNDFTEQFVRGAKEVIKICRQCSIKSAILKSGSPSCGYGEIYDGSFSGNKINGNGVTAELLVQNNIKIYTQNNINFIRE